MAYLYKGLSSKRWKMLRKSAFLACLGLFGGIMVSTYALLTGTQPLPVVHATGNTKIIVRSTNANINVLDASNLVSDPINYPSADPYYTGLPTPYSITHLGTLGGATSIVGPNREYQILTNAVSTKLIAPIISQQDPRWGFTGWLGCNTTENNWNIDTNTGNWIPNSNQGPGNPIPDQYAETCVISYADDGASHVVTANYQTATVQVNSGGFLFSGQAVKILDKSVADQPSASGDPNTYAPTALGTYGGTTNYTYQTPGKLIKLIAPQYSDVAYNSRPGKYQFINWTGCGALEDNYDTNWNKTISNGGTATPDGVPETCLTNFPNDGNTYTVVANFRATWLKISSNLAEVPILDAAKIGQPGFVSTDPLSYPNNYGNAGQPDLGLYGGRIEPFNNFDEYNNIYRYNYYSFTPGGNNNIIIIPPNYTFNGTTYQMRGITGCTQQDRYDATWNLVTTYGGSAIPDGVSDSCLLNYANTGAVFYDIKIDYNATNVTVYGSNGLQILDSSIVGTPGYTNPDPNSYPGTTPVLGFGKVGGRTTVYSSQSGYTRPTQGGTIKLIAPRTNTPDPRFGFVQWNSCTNTVDDYDSSWNPVGIPGLHNPVESENETCVLTFPNDNLTRSVTPIYDAVDVSLATNLPSVHILDTLNLGQPGCTSPNPDDPIYTDNPPLGSGYNRGEFFGGHQCGPIENRTLASLYLGGYYDNQSNYASNATNRKLIFSPTHIFNAINFPLQSISGCGGVLSDEYTSAWTPGTDGINETYTINLLNTSPDCTITINYAFTLVNIGVGTGFIDYYKTWQLLDASTLTDIINYPSPDPNSYNTLISMGPYGYRSVGQLFPPQNTFYTVGINNARLIAPLVNQTQGSNPLTQFGSSFIGWTGCSEAGVSQVEDRYNQSWQLTTTYGGTATPDGVFETCNIIAMPNDGISRTFAAQYRNTSIKVGTNIPAVTILNKAVVGSPGHTNPNPDFYSSNYANNTGLMGSRTSTGLDVNYNSYVYDNFVPGGFAQTGGTPTKLIAPLQTANSPAYFFSNWTGCAFVEDNYDANWQATIFNGGTAAADGVFETCVLSNFANDGDIAFYNGKIVRANYTPVTRLTVGSNACDYFSGSDQGVFLDKDYYVAGSPAANQGGIPDNYTAANLGYFGGAVNCGNTYQRNLVGHLTGALIAAPRTVIQKAYQTTINAQLIGWTGCTTLPNFVEDRFDLLGNLTTTYGGTATPDGIFETCNFSYADDGADHSITAVYQTTRLNIQTNITNINILKATSYGTGVYTSPDPSSYTFNGAECSVFSNNCWSLAIGGNYTYFDTFGTTNFNLIASLKGKQDSRYIFNQWTNCTNTQDNWSVNLSGSVNGAWTAGTDGANETCSITFGNDGIERTVNATYFLSSVIFKTNKAGTQFLDQNAVVGNGNPNSYAPNALGLYGSTATNYWNASYSYYQKILAQLVPVQASLAGRVIAPYSSTLDNLWGFEKWTGCTSVEDNWYVNPVTGVWSAGTDGIYETCVFSFANDNLPHEIQADYSPTRIRVVSNKTGNQFLDRTLVGTVGYPSANPNTYNFATTFPGFFGGTTSTPFGPSKYQYLKFAAIPNGSVVAPLTDTISGNAFLGWTNCPNAQDLYTAAWTLGTDGIAETCNFSFAPDGLTHTIEANYATPVSTSTIGDTVFFDYNGNGIKDVADTGIGGVQVTLWQDTNENGIVDGAEALTSTTQNTNGSGVYNFTALQPGQYILQVTDNTNVVSGYTITIGVPNTNNNSQGSGQKVIVISGLNTSINYMDFGYTLTGSIGNQVFLDSNNNGIFDGGETGISGVTLQLYTDVNLNGTYENGIDTLASTANTNGFGIYQFGAVPLGKYIVRPVLSSPSLNTMVSTQTPSSIASPLDNQARDVLNYPVTLTLTTPATVLADFGFRINLPTSTIGDQVFFDYNGNGIFEPPVDEGIANVDVTLWVDANANGVLDGSENLSSVVLSTNSSGNYLFNNLPVGAYLIRITDSTNILTGLTSTLGTSNTNNNSQGSGLVPILITSNGQSINYGDFGYRTTGVLSGKAFDDLDNDAQYNNTDTLLANINVYLYEDSNANSVFDSGVDTLVSTAVTNSSGVYTFGSLTLKKNYIVVADTNSPGAVGKVSTATASSNATPSSGYAKFVSGYGSFLSQAITSITYIDFGFYTPPVPPNPLIAPAGLTSVQKISDTEVEWKLELRNIANTTATAVLAINHIPGNTTLVVGSVNCVASQSSTVQSCSYNSTTNSVDVAATLSQYTGPIASSTESNWLETPVEAQGLTGNSVILTFRTTLNTVFREFLYQARIFWDESGDLVIDTNDTSYAANTPRLSDDPTLPGLFDATVYRLSPIPQLILTGLNYLWIVIFISGIVVATSGIDTLRFFIQTVRVRLS